MDFYPIPYRKVNIADRVYFRLSMQGKIAVSDVISSRGSGKPVFVVSAPMQAPNREEIGGVLLGVIDLSHFTSRFVDPVHVGQSGYAYVLNQDGLIVARPDKTNILKLDMKSFDFGREMLTRGNGIISYVWQGAEKLVAFKTSQTLGWVVATGAVTSELLAPVQRLGSLNLLLTVGGALLAAGVLFLLTRLVIVRPLAAMARVAHKLAEGDVNQQIIHRSRDEIGMLAEAFRGFLGYLTEMTGAADRLSKGDLTVQVQARSEVDVLSHSFQRVTETLQRMVSETQTLIQRAQEGQLKARGDATKFAGAYAEVIQGINAMLQAILTPIEEAATVLDQIASRDLTARIQGTYQGEYARIKKSLNTAVHNLDEGFTQVASAAEQVASAAGQINSGSQSLASGASEQASSLEEVSSNLQELVAMSQQNTNNAHEVRQLAEQSHTSAEKGTASMQRLSVAIHKIKASADATAKIVKTIDDIAFQTNLLALNAAVEAARAGDAGKGFAVVADEVRNLAIRSAEAAKNTAQMLEESVQNAEAGVALHQEVLTNLEEITTGAQRGNVMMGEIATASDQQQQGIAQINVAVDQMNHVTQQTAANAQQAASTAAELAGQAEALQRLLTVFNLTKKEVTTRAWTQPTLLAPRQHIQASHPSKELGMVGQNSRSHNISAPLRSEDVIPFDDEDGTTLQEF